MKGMKKYELEAYTEAIRTIEVQKYIIKANRRFARDCVHVELCGLQDSLPYVR